MKTVIKIFDSVLVLGFCLQVVNKVLEWRKYCKEVRSKEEWMSGGIVSGLISASIFLSPFFLLSLLLHIFPLKR